MFGALKNYTMGRDDIQRDIIPKITYWSKTTSKQKCNTDFVTYQINSFLYYGCFK